MFQIQVTNQIYKLANFIISHGINSTATNCLLMGFINPLETACLQCNTGYYFVDKECPATCPAGYAPHEDTKSCQRNLSHCDCVLII